MFTSQKFNRYQFVVPPLQLRVLGDQLLDSYVALPTEEQERSFAIKESSGVYMVLSTRLELDAFRAQSYRPDPASGIVHN